MFRFRIKMYNDVGQCVYTTSTERFRDALIMSDFTTERFLNLDRIVRIDIRENERLVVRRNIHLSTKELKRENVLCSVS